MTVAHQVVTGILARAGDEPAAEGELADDEGFVLREVVGSPSADKGNHLDEVGVVQGVVGVLGGGNRNNPDPLCGCYEWQPFNGTFHRNSRVRIAEISEGTSNTVGVGERDNRFVQSSWVGVLPGAEVIYNPDKHLGCKNWRPAITAVVVHSRQYTVNRPDASPAAFHTLHPGGGNFLLMDGSVRYIKDTVDLDTMRALCTRNYGEVISSDAY